MRPYLFVFSFCGLALFVPFSIAGANIAIFAGFIGMLIAAFTDPAARARYGEIKRDPMFAACLILVVSAFPSVLMSEDAGRALKDFKSYWLLLIYFLVAYNLVSSRLRRIVFWILLVSTTASSLFALLQKAGGLEFWFIHIPWQNRPGGTLFKMTFSGILYQLILVNLAVAIGSRSFDKRALAVGSAGLTQIAALIATMTRGAWFALAGGLLAIPALLNRWRLLFAVLGLGLVVVVVASRSDIIRQRTDTLFGDAQQHPDRSTATRYVLWDISWELFAEHPMLGIGMGDYSIEVEKRLEEREVLTMVDSHNIYLQILATRGLVGFIPFVIFWVILFRVLRAAKRQTLDSDDRFGYHFAAGTIAATIAILLGALTENNIDDSEIFICLMFLVGIARSFGSKVRTGTP